MTLRWIMAAIALLCLSACQHDKQSRIFQQFSLQDGQSISIDAHQRAILTTRKPNDPDDVRIIFCSEPGPDSFAHIYDFFSASLAGPRFVDEEQAAKMAALLSTKPSNDLSTRNVRQARWIRATIQVLSARFKVS